MEATKADVIKRNVRLKHRNRELETILKMRKQHSLCLRIKCAVREFFKEFYRV